MSSPPSIADPTTRLVVADAGPLISLGRIDHLPLLPRLFGTVHVPQAVLDECLARPEQADARRIREACAIGWLQLGQAPPIQAAELDVGECAAIGLALALRAALLTDDNAARRYALGLALPVMGTLGVLVLGKRRALLTEVAPLIGRLRAGGLRLGAEAVAQALAAAGESPPASP